MSNSTPRFLTDDEESREQPSSVRQCSKLLLVGGLGLIINSFFFAIRNYSSSRFLYRLCILLVSQLGVFHLAMKKYRAGYHQHNSEI